MFSMLSVKNGAFGGASEFQQPAIAHQHFFPYPARNVTSTRWESGVHAFCTASKFWKHSAGYIVCGGGVSERAESWEGDSCSLARALQTALRFNILGARCQRRLDSDVLNSNARGFINFPCYSIRVCRLSKTRYKIVNLISCWIIQASEMRNERIPFLCVFLLPLNFF